jgi:AcrR family transcriptional regulator
VLQPLQVCVSCTSPRTVPPVNDDLGLRERKKRRTRAALHRAAFELCVERGVEDVTVADIAARADVSARTFFPTKEEAMVGGADRAEQLAEILAGRPLEEPLWDALRAAVAEVLAGEEVPERDFLARFRLAIESPSLAPQQLASWMAIEEVLAVEVARRTDAEPTDLRPRLVVATAVAAVRVAMNHWIDTPSDRSLADALDDALVAVAEGLAPSPAPTG